MENMKGKLQRKFTKQILTPVTEDVFNTIVFQGEGVDAILRLLARGFEVQNWDSSFVRFIANDPRRPEEYKEFRRIVQHLQWLFYNRKLFIRTLLFDETLIEKFPTAPQPYDINQGIFNDLVWRAQPDGTFSLTRTASGRLVITNYDPNTLTDQERWDMNLRIKKTPASFVHLDIDPCCPGGDFPILGKISLRSIVQMLDFIARGVRAHPEFDVEKDPRTGPVQANPIQTLKVNVTDTAPARVTSAQFDGKYFSIGQTEWDLSVFRILSWLFQASVGEVKSPGIPITISK